MFGAQRKGGGGEGRCCCSRLALPGDRCVKFARRRALFRRAPNFASICCLLTGDHSATAALIHCSRLESAAPEAAVLDPAPDAQVAECRVAASLPDCQSRGRSGPTTAAPDDKGEAQPDGDAVDDAKPSAAAQPVSLAALNDSRSSGASFPNPLRQRRPALAVLSQRLVRRQAQRVWAAAALRPPRLRFFLRGCALSPVGQGGWLGCSSPRVV